MKKIYLLVLLVITNFFSFSQESLPYAFSFENDPVNVGWTLAASQDADECFNTDLFGWYSMEGCFTFFSAFPCGYDYRQYLVTPQLVNGTTDSVQVRFKYKAANPADPNYPEVESFVVGYYTGSSFASMDDFVWSENTVFTSDFTNWQDFVCNLPPTVNYIAIAYTSGIASGLMVDDVLVRANASGITYPFEVLADEGGTVSLTVGDVTTIGTTMVPEGEDVTFTLASDPGYLIDTMWLDGILNFAPRGRELYSQTVTSVIAPHSLRVKFKHLMYTITLDVAEHGHVVPDGGTSHQMLVPWDTTVGFRIYPDEGYAINYLAVNNDRIWDNPDTVTLANIRSNITLHVTFAPRQYLIAATAGAGGTISPSDTVAVSGAQNAQFYIAANPGYVIDSVFVDGAYFSAAHRLSAYIYTFPNVHEDHTITATFFHKPYIVHYTATEHGELLVTGGVSVGLDSVSLYYEDTLTFHFVPDEGYEIADLQLNGASVGTENPFVLTQVTQNSLFHAVFAEKTFSVVSHSHGAGRVTPAQTGQVGYFDTVRLAVTPLFCMQTDSILFDDSYLDISDTLCFTHIEGAHQLEAYFSQIYYTMEMQPTVHGSMTGNSRVVCDGSARFQLLPDPCYRLSHFYLDGEVRDDLLRTISDTIWATVSSVSADHTVAATFERLEYTVQVNVSGNGTVTPSGLFNVLCDSTISIEIVPDECHYAVSFKVNGVEVDNDVVRVPSGRDGFGDTLRYELANIQQDYTVAVEFRQFVYPLVTSAGPHGSLSTSDTVWMACGQDTDVVITPDACYDIASVLADGVDAMENLVYQGSSALYSVEEPHTSHALAVTFEKREYTVSLQAGEHGSVLPLGDTTVLCGNDLSVVIVPDQCYRIDTIWLDGTVANDLFTYRQNANYRIGDSALYVFSNMEESHQVRVSFRPITYAHRIWYSGNGTVTSTVAGSTVNCGEDVTVTMTPADCYYIQYVYRNGYTITDYQLDEQGVGTLLLPDADGDMYISVVFAQKEHSVTLAQQPVHGAVGIPARPVLCGSDVRLSFVPDACYHLDSVMIDGSWLMPEEGTVVGDTFFYWIRNIHSDVEVAADFSIDKFHFVSSEGAPLSVADTLIDCGQPLTVFAIQTNCTRLDSIRLNGQIYNLNNFSGGTAYYSFDTVYVSLDPFYGDCQLDIFFSTLHYEVNPLISGLGRVEVESPVMCGEDARLRIIPADCQYLESVTMNEWQDYSLLGDTLVIIRNMFQDVDVAVNFSTYKYEMTVEDALYGEIVGPQGLVECGTNLTYRFVPNDCAKLDEVYLDGILVNNLIDSTDGLVLAIDSIASDHNLKAVFSIINYQVEVIAEDYSFVNLAAQNIVSCGDSLQLVVRPDECHYLSDVLLDGTSIMADMMMDGGQYQYTLYNVRQDHSFEVRSGQKRYPVFVNRRTPNDDLLSSDTTSILCGKDTTLAATPFDECYKIDSVFVNGVQAELRPEYEFHSITDTVTLDVYMHRIDYVVEVASLGHTSLVEGAMWQTVVCDSSLHLAFEPEEGYHIIALIVDEEELPAASFYDFLNVHSDHTISVKTEIYSYMVRTHSEGNGSVAPDSVAVNYGENVEVLIKPDDCHYLAQLTVNGQPSLDSVVPQESHFVLTLSHITSDQEVTAVFAQLEYAVSAGAGEGGSITPVQATVLCGDSQEFRIVTADCYHLEKIVVNGTPSAEGWTHINGDTLGFTLADLREDSQIEAVFAKDAKTLTVENGDGGTVQPSSATVLCGDDYHILIMPDSCRTLASVKVNGMDVMPLLTYLENANPWLPDTAVYEAADVRVDQQVSVTYGYEQPHHLPVSFLANGNILSYNNIEVGCGNDTIVTLTYDCYTLDSLRVDGVSTAVADSYRFEDVIADHTVEAFFHKNQYEIEAVAAANGTILPAGTTTVACDGSKTYTITPAEGYYIEALIVDGETVSPSSTYTFTNVRENHTIEPVFAIHTYIVDVETVGSGTVMPGDTTVNYGASVHYDFVAADCHSVDSVVINGVNVGAVNAYTIDNIVEDKEVRAFFSINEYTVSVTVSDHGTVTNTGVNTVICGESLVLTITPDDCYQLAMVLLDGEPVSVQDNELRLENVRSNHNVEVTFGRTMYVQQVTSGLGGSVLPVAPSVACGENQTFVITPINCYHIDTVWINGTVLPSDSLTFNGDAASFTLYNVRQENEIAVSFAVNPYQITVENGDGGAVQTSSTTVLCGDDYRILIMPDSCRTLASVTVNGENVMPLLTYLENANPWLPDTAVYEAVDVRVDQQVSVTYGYEQPHHLAVSFLSNGNILSYNNIEVGCGNDTLVSLTYDCYTLDSLRVDGVSSAVADSYRFEDVIADHTVEAFFHKNQYEIEAVAAANGTILPAGTTTVACDGSKTYTITPAEGYYIEALIVDGETVSPSSTYTFTNVRESHTIEPVFAIHTYIVDVETVGSGTVIPSDTTVNYGASVHYDFIAADCHSVDSVVINGVNVGAVNTYTIENIIENKNVTAYFSLNGYEVSVGTEEHGRVILDTNRVNCGGSVGFTVVADACYALDSVLVNGTNVGAVSSYTIENIREQQLVDAYFSQMVYSVTVSDGIQHGTVVPSAAQVLCGGDVTLTVHPDDCYSVDSVLVNGVNVGGVLSYTIENIVENQNVIAFFSINEFTVSVTASDHGTVTNTGANTVLCGESLVLTITPDDCYQMAALLLDGEPVSVQDNELRLENVRSDHAVEVTFGRTMYVQQVTSGLGGSVMPAAPSVACGENQTFVVTPINCYHIDTVWVNGTVLPSDSLTFNGDAASFTLYNVRQVNEIAVSFSGNHYQFMVDNHGNGTVHLEQNSIECDGEATFYILPVACEQISNVVLNGTDIAENIDYHTNVNPLLPDTAFYTISQMNEDKYLVIDYAALPDNHIAVTYTDGISTLYTADSVLACGGSVQFSIDYDCYTLDSVLLDGVNRGAQTELTVESNLADRALVAYFSKNMYLISVDETVGGSVEVSGTLSVECGESRTFMVTTEPCYSLDSVLVNGLNVGAVSSYTIENIRENQMVKAYFSLDIHTVTVTSGEGGSITLDGSPEVACGSNLTVSITPDDCYDIENVMVDGVELGAIISYTFENVTADHTLSATFTMREYTATAATPEHGSITLEANRVACGSSVNITVASEDCYSIDSVLVNGLNVGAVSSYTIENIRANQTVEAYFSLDVHTVSVTAGEGGTVLPLGDTTVSCGTNLTVSITPDDCYDIENVLVDGVELGAITSYTFENVEASHTLSATFVMREYTLTPVVRGGGSVSPNVTTTVPCGSDFIFRFTPNEGYYVNGVVLDGDTLPAADSCLLTGITANHTVQPLFTLSQYEITATAGEGGSVSPEYALVDYQDRQTVRITAADCYHIDSVFVDGAYVGAVSNYTFNNVTAPHTLQAVFAINTYALTASSEGAGTIAPAGDTTVNCGDNITYAIVPESGWHLTELLVDGAAVETTESYTFADVRGNHTITARFAINEYTVTATAGEGGSVSPSVSEASYGENVTVSINAADCYYIDSVFADGMYVGAVESYTFENVTADHTLSATFAMNEFTVTAATSEHGSITLDANSVACGGSVNIIVASEDCYSIDSVLVNGLNVGAVSSYTIENVRENQTVEAYFSAQTYGLSLTAGAGGTVLPLGDTTVSCGTNLTVSIIPDDCYDIENVMVDGVEQGAITSYTFENVDASHTLSATFVMREYTLTPVVRGGGSVSPNVTTTVPCGSDFTFRFTPNEGYYVSGVVLDGDTLPAADSCLLTGITANHTVQPLFTLSQYEITATAGEGGSVSPEYALVDYQGRQTVRITAADCYHIDSVFVDDAYVGTASNYTFNNVTAPHTLQAVFAINTYALTASSEGAGTIAPAGDTMVNCGENITYAIVPETGWHLTELLVDGAVVEPTESYTFADVRGNHTITARFAINEYTVTATAGEGGSVTPAVSEASYGENVTVSINAADCYYIDSVFADGMYVGAVESYTFENVTADHTLTATFAMREYAVVAATSEHGTVSLDADYVLCGGSVNITVASDDCYSIDSVLVNGLNVGAVSSYTIENVRENQMVKAYFSLDVHTVSVTVGEGGTVTLDGSNEVACGDSRTISVTPDACFTIDSVVVNGTNLGVVTSYTITNITEDQTIAAYFSRNVYSVTAVAEAGGSITPEGVSALACGSEITYAITPAVCYQVDSVVVNGMNIGAVTTCTVTGSDELGDQSVHAYFSAMSYPLELSAGEGGTVTISGETTVDCGSNISVSIIPDECHNIDNVMVDGVSMGAITSYTFEEMDAPHTVSATFAIRQYRLVPRVEEGGSITPNVPTTVPCGSDFTFHFIPNSGYYVSGVVLDGDTLPAADSCLLTGITADHTVQPLFTLSQYEITATAGEGGSVSPEYAQVNYQGRQTIRITAADCYHIDSVFVDGAYVGRSSRYTFSNVVADHELRAVFAYNTYTLNASVEGEGTITPVGDTTVNCGESITYTITPADGWHLAALQVDGASSPLAYSHTFENIRANHTIFARFAINEFEVTATAGAGGAVSPSLVEASYGDTVTIEITADDCYHIDSVFVDDVYVGAMSSYTFNTMSDNHTLHATFAVTEYTVAVLPNPQHGTITPQNMTTVNCGDSVRYTIVPDEGYRIAELLVDGIAENVSETYVFTDIHENHRITAVFVLDEYTVTATAGEGGSVTPAETVVNFGDSVTIEIAAADCYHIDSVFVDGVYEGAVSSYTFRNIDEDHTLSATFAMDEYTVTAATPEHGSITLDENRVACGGSVDFTVASEECYSIDSVLVNGWNVGAVSSYTIENVRANQTVEAYFSLDVHTVSLTAGAGGTVQPLGDTTVFCGTNLTVTIIPDDCYDIENVLVDGVELGAITSYTFENVDASHTLLATFVMREYTVTAATSEHGSITLDENRVACGGSVDFTVASEECYSIDSVLVNGWNVGAVSSYTIENVRANQTVEAYFSLDVHTVSLTAGAGGTVQPLGDTTVFCGSNLTVTIIPDDCYDIENVLVDGVELGAITSYTFENVGTNHTLSATFVMNVYDIHVTVISEESEVFYTTILNVPCGTDTLVGVPLFYCYDVDSIVVNGVVEFGEDSLLVQNVTEDMDVIFYLSREQFAMVASKQGSGTVTPMDTTYASCDDELSYTFVPDEGWFVQNIIVDGDSLGTPANDTYTFYNIHENHTIEVIFSPNVYIITSSIDPIDAGHITPYGTTAVTYGEDQTFNITPFSGYEVIDVEVDGVSQGAITTYTFYRVEANHTIVAHLMTVGVEEATANEEIAVWPNPVENVCHIQLPAIHNAEIQLFDVKGKLILRKQADADEVEIDLSQRPSGMYLLRVVSDGNVVTTKKVIRK